MSTQRGKGREATPPMPTRAMTRTIDAVKAGEGHFDPDAWHVMDARDNEMISQELLHGAGSSKFIYRFNIQGKEVTGISVIGARHLAAHYGGIKHRLLASTSKTGDLFVFTSYPSEGVPMHVSCSIVPELTDEPDYYSALVEITDIKTGNTIQQEARETRYERRRDGSEFERPHYAAIAQAKAYRNGVLAMIRQDIQMAWKLDMLQLGRDDLITSSLLDEKRAGILKFAAAKAIPVDRRALESLTLDQISGLSEAVRTSGPEQFVKAAMALRILMNERDTITATSPSSQAHHPATASTPPVSLVPNATTVAAMNEPADQRKSFTDTAALMGDLHADEPATDAVTQPPPENVWYLSDQNGEVPSENGGPHTDPVRAALALVEICNASTNPATTIEVNADVIEDLRVANVEAATILDQAIAKFWSPPGAPSDMPPSAATVEEQSTPQDGPDQHPSDTDWRRAADFAKEFQAQTSIASLEAFTRSASLVTWGKRMRSEKPQVAEWLSAQYETRREQLGRKA